MTPTTDRHQGPPLWLPAVMYVLLFLAGLYPVTIFGGRPFYPGPEQPLDVMVEFFRLRSSGVLLCAFLQFGAAIPLALFTATAVSRLRFLGVRAAGAEIALFGGFAASILMLASSSILWVMTFPGMAQNRDVLHALYRLSFALGGPGFSVPFGLLAAGLTIPALLYRFIPKWVGILGIIIAIAGELSWIQIVVPKAIPLIPLTRFPGFVWIIAVALTLPKTRRAQAA